MSPLGRRPVDAAVIYARRGWAVFPCHHPIPGVAGCSCGLPDCSSPAKHPRVAGGLKAATTDEHRIRQWWARWPHANVAIRTGAASGLVVIDVDPPHGGDTSLAALVDRHGPLPDGRVVRTGSGGCHIYLAHPGGVVRNDNGRRLGPGIDVRGDGGYVIAPPSHHPSGDTYAWTARATALPACPQWLVELLHPPERRLPPLPAPSLDHDRTGAWAGRALDAELASVRAAAEGMRNATLNRAAFSLGQIVAGGLLDETVVAEALVASASTIGLGEREARATVASGMDAGRRSPRQPPAPHIQPRPPPLPGAEPAMPDVGPAA